MSFERIEGGGAEQFTLVTSVDLDADPLFTLRNYDDLLVASGPAVSSSNGHYYQFVAMPTSPGFYRTHWEYVLSANTFVADDKVEVLLTSVNATAGFYCDANQVRNVWKPLNDGDYTNIEFDETIVDKQNIVDTALSARYATPFATGVNSLPPIITTITKKLVVLEYAKKTVGDLPDWVEKDMEMIQDMLEAIAEGTMLLPLADGSILEKSISTQIGKADHSMENYVPTFNLLDVEDQRVDPDLLVDTEADL